MFLPNGFVHKNIISQRDLSHWLSLNKAVIRNNIHFLRACKSINKAKQTILFQG